MLHEMGKLYIEKNCCFPVISTNLPVFIWSFYSSHPSLDYQAEENGMKLKDNKALARPQPRLDILMSNEHDQSYGSKYLMLVLKWSLRKDVNSHDLRGIS